MSKEIDWSKAPEGAEFYEPPYESGVCGAFVKTVTDGSGWKWWNGSVWQCHLGMTAERKSTLIARPSAWTGQGLPPVGTVCEWKLKQEFGYAAAEVLFVSDKSIVLRRADGFEWQESPARCCFRPIHTPEQIAAEERADAVKEMIKIAFEKSIDSYGELHVHTMAEILYDHGYRKTEVGK